MWSIILENLRFLKTISEVHKGHPRHRVLMRPNSPFFLPLQTPASILRRVLLVVKSLIGKCDALL